MLRSKLQLEHVFLHDIIDTCLLLSLGTWRGQMEPTTAHETCHFSRMRVAPYLRTCFENFRIVKIYASHPSWWALQWKSSNGLFLFLHNRRMAMHVGISLTCDVCCTSRQSSLTARDWQSSLCCCYSALYICKNIRTRWQCVCFAGSYMLPQWLFALMLESLWWLLLWCTCRPLWLIGGVQASECDTNIWGQRLAMVLWWTIFYCWARVLDFVEHPAEPIRKGRPWIELGSAVFQIGSSVATKDLLFDSPPLNKYAPDKLAHWSSIARDSSGGRYRFWKNGTILFCSKSLSRFFPRILVLHGLLLLIPGWWAMCSSSSLAENKVPVSILVSAWAPQGTRTSH